MFTPRKCEEGFIQDILRADVEPIVDQSPGLYLGNFSVPWPTMSTSLTRPHQSHQTCSVYMNYSDPRLDDNFCPVGGMATTMDCSN